MNPVRIMRDKSILFRGARMMGQESCTHTAYRESVDVGIRRSARQTLPRDVIAEEDESRERGRIAFLANHKEELEGALAPNICTQHHALLLNVLYNHT